MRKKSTVNRLLALSFFFLLFAENSSALPTNRIKNVIFEKERTRESAVIELDYPPIISWFTLKNPDRIAIDIDDAFLPKVSFQKRTAGEVIKKIRGSQNTKNVVRIVLDLKLSSPYEFHIETKPSNKKTALHLTVLYFEDDYAKSFDTIKKNPFAPILAFDTKIFPSTTKHLPLEENSDDIGLSKSTMIFENAHLDNLFEEDASNLLKKTLSISGRLQTKGASQIQEDETVENNTSFRNSVLIEAKYEDSFIVSSLSDYLFLGSEDESHNHNLEIHEAKWRHRNQNLDLVLGKQIIRWGKTDQISPVDTLNPEDLREFVLPDYEERKIPVWMADLRLFFDRFSIEGFVIPFFENARFDYFKADWSVFGHMKKEIRNSPVAQSTKAYFENLTIHEQFPANETEWGLRLTTTVKTIDLDFTYHRTTEDLPYFMNFPVKNLDVSGGVSRDELIQAMGSAVFTDQAVEVEYRRTNIAGFAFETTLSDLGLRGEAVWRDTESFLTSSLTSVQNTTFTYILGADHTTKNNTYLNLQLAHRHISGYDPGILYFDMETVSLLGEIRMDLVSDWLTACAKFTQNLTDNSLYLNPYLKYTYITNLECRVGAALFSGDSDTWFGRYRDGDLFYLDIVYRF